jgi:hypothetical protein
MSGGGKLQDFRHITVQLDTRSVRLCVVRCKHDAVDQSAEGFRCFGPGVGGVQCLLQIGNLALIKSRGIWVKMNNGSRDVSLRLLTQQIWPAPGSEDTELGVLMGPEVCDGEAQVHAGVQA